MESYLDRQNTNNWTKVTDLIDNGGWYAASTDKEFIVLAAINRKII
ncbi:MAG: hypothetical protein K0R16_1789 [Nitrososphaeraceae archaeon]|jgi:hypothetical protein|nr:hypothetical protein [Nitrososphaeraceae archaeon]MDF2769563.1 hypothetical protein [Nitrososphaeraceae archaeon]